MALSPPMTWPSAAGTRTSHGPVSSSSFSMRSTPGWAVSPNRAAGRDDLDERGDVETPVVAHAAVDVRHGDHRAAPGGRLPRHPRTHVAEPLDGEAQAGEVEAPALGMGLEHVDHPPPGGRLAPRRAAEVDRLPGDDRGRVAVVGRVGVHHPRHRLGVGVHVGRRDVAVRADDVVDAVGEAAGHPLELGRAHRRRVDLDAALGPAERHVHERGLPRHQRRQRPHLLEVGGRVVADAALVGPAGAVVLDAVAAGDDHVPAVEPHRDLHGDLAIGGREHRVHLDVEVDEARRLVDVPVHGLEGGQPLTRHGACLPRRVGAHNGWEPRTDRVALVVEDRPPRESTAPSPHRHRPTIGISLVGGWASTVRSSATDGRTSAR